MNNLKFSIGKSLFSILFLFPLASCQKPAQNPGAVLDPNAVQVSLIDANTFPKEMVGSWYNQQYGWILRFEPDGRILNITHSIGLQDVSAGQKATIPLKEGGSAVFEPGTWFVQYNGTTHELAVEITLKSFNYWILGNVIKGSSRDTFVGKLSDPKEAVWRANWISFPEYNFTTADKAYTDYRLPVEKENEDKGEIVFIKFDPKEVKENQ